MPANIPKYSGAELYVNKLAAADRQLDAAIRIYFMEEDKLAIHTLASAAYSVLSDLQRNLGREEANFSNIYGFWRAAKDHVDGKMSESEIRSWGDGAWEYILPIIKKISEDPTFSVDHINVLSSLEETKRFWRKIRENANFLKHADQDSSKLLKEGDLENEKIILRAISAALHLNVPLSYEKRFFYTFLHATDQLNGPIPEVLKTEVSELRALGNDHLMILARRALCRSRFQN